MAKLIKIFVGLFVVISAILIAIPFFVNVDKYRPQIVKAVNENINGRLELGKLNLRLWGTMKVGIEGLDLTDTQKRKIISVKDAYVAIPWSSIFGGSPLLTIHMNQPEVRVVKQSDGKYNILSLMKGDVLSAQDQSANSQASAGAASGSAAKSVALPAFATNARVGVDLNNAHFYYKDEVSKSETQTKNLNLRVKDLSLTRATEVELSGVIESAQENVFQVSGPFRVELEAKPSLGSGKVQGLAAKLDADFSDIEINAGAAFKKSSSVKAKIEGEFKLSQTDIEIEELKAEFFNVKLEASGKAANINQPAPLLELNIKTNTVDLASWNELVPMLKEYSLSGKADLSAWAKGPMDKIQYAGDFSIKDFKMKSEYLKQEPVINATVKISTDKIEKLLATLKAPGNDVTVEGTLVSFLAPKLDLKVTSNSLDLDQFIKLPELKDEPASKKESKAAADGSKGGEANSQSEYDKMLDPLRKNAIAANTTAVASINAKLIKFYDVKVTDFNAKLSLRNLVTGIDSSSFKIWDGTVATRASVAMKPSTPTYTFNTSVSNLDLQKAVTSKLKLFKNTVIGKLSLKMEGNGSSFDPEKAKKTMVSKGLFKVENAVFDSIDIAKVTTEAVNKALEKVGDKIPGAKGKRLKGLPERSSKYEFISTDFTIAGGKFSSPNFFAKALANQGVDIKGLTDVNFINRELKADWDVIDTWNLTGARDVSFNMSGVDVQHVLAEGNNPVSLPIVMGCKVDSPCPSYNKVPEHFVKVAMGNVKKGATQAVKQEAKEKAKDAGKKLLKGLFK